MPADVARPVWLKQVHGTRVIDAAACDVSVGQIPPEGDAAFARSPGLACAVMTADCLPVLLCDTQGMSSPPRTPVGAAFVGVDPDAATAFQPPGGGKYLSDIYLPARQRLMKRGVERVFGSSFCTVSEPERFFSYRRDGQTGRMALLIWISGDRSVGRESHEATHPDNRSLRRGASQIKR